MRAASRAAAVLLILSVVACTTTAPPVDRYPAIQTAVLATQSAAQAFGLVYQTQKVQDPVAWGKRYDLAQVSYQGSQLLLLTAINEAILSEPQSGTRALPATWLNLKEQASVPFEALAGPK